MKTRAAREGSVGLLVLLGLGLVTGLIFWIRGFNFGGKAYNLEVELADALGLSVGSPVKFRGVKVGHITQMRPQVQKVLVDVEISSNTILIPRQTNAETSQSGFVGQAALEFRPTDQEVSAAMLQNLSPLEPDCDPRFILCQGDRIKGDSGNNLEALIRATMQIANQLGGTDLKATLNNLSQASQDISQLSKDTKVTLQEVARTARGINQLSLKGQRQLQQFGAAADSVGLAAQEFQQLGREMNTFVRLNKGTVATSLQSLQATSQDLKGIVSSLGPVLNRADQGQLLDNLEQLAVNGAETAKKLNRLTSAIDTPDTISEIQETVKIAKKTLKNAEKITTDLEKLSGNQEFQQNLLRLINGLGKLLSSSQDLEQQLQVSQVSVSVTPFPSDRLDSLTRQSPQDYEATAPNP